MREDGRAVSLSALDSAAEAEHVRATADVLPFQPPGEERPLGRTFYALATEPLRAHHAALETKDAVGALAAVAGDRLLSAVHAAVDAVARATEVDRQVVMGRLPVDEVERSLAGISSAHETATSVWQQHHGGVADLIGRVAGAVVEAHLGFGGAGVGEYLGSLAGGAIGEARLATPLQAMWSALHRYEQTLARAACELDDAELTAAAENVRARRRMSATAAGLAYVVVIAAWLASPILLFRSDSGVGWFFILMLVVLATAVVRNSHRKRSIGALVDEYVGRYGEPPPGFSASTTGAGWVIGSASGNGSVGGLIGAAADLAMRALGQRHMTGEQKALHDKITGLEVKSPYRGWFYFGMWLTTWWALAGVWDLVSAPEAGP